MIVVVTIRIVARVSIIVNLWLVRLVIVSWLGWSSLISVSLLGAPWIVETLLGRSMVLIVAILGLMMLILGRRLL